MSRIIPKYKVALSTNESFLSSEHDNEDETVNTVLDEVADKESMMSEQELKLRDQLNKELSKKGLHLRLASVTVRGNDYGFDFVRPIHKWSDEWPETDRYVTKRLGELVRGH